MYKRILVATDNSPLSKKAVTHAIGLAAGCGAQLIVLNVIPRYPTSYLEGAVVFAPEDIRAIEKKWDEEARASLASAVAEAEAQHVYARASVVRSEMVAEAILSAARKHRTDLIVMASHGRKGVKRLLLGSETQNVLTQSTLPVLVLR